MGAQSGERQRRRGLVLKMALRPLLVAVVMLAVGVVMGLEESQGGVVVSEMFEGDAVEGTRFTVGDQVAMIQEDAVAMMNNPTPPPPCAPTDTACKKMEELLERNKEVRYKEGVKIQNQYVAYKKNETEEAGLLTMRRKALVEKYAKIVEDEKVKLMIPYTKQAAVKVARSYQLAEAGRCATVIIKKQQAAARKVHVQILDKVRVFRSEAANATMKERIAQFMSAVVASAKSPEQDPVVVKATAEKKEAVQAVPKVAGSSMRDETDAEFLLSVAEDAPAVKPAQINNPVAGGAAADMEKELNGRPENAPKKGSKEEKKIMKEMVEGAFQVVAKGEKIDSYLGPPLSAPSASSVEGAYQQYWYRKDKMAESAAADAAKAVKKAEAAAKVILAEKGATDPAYEAALDKVTDLKAIQDNVGRSKGDALRAVDDVRIAYKKVVASKGEASAEAIAAKRKMVSMEKALAELKGLGPEDVEAKPLQEAKRAIELIERQRLYAELRHRERFMWNKDIDTKTDLYVKELMNKQLNSTIDVFKDDLKQRLDLNDTQIA